MQDFFLFSFDLIYKNKIGKMEPEKNCVKYFETNRAKNKYIFMYNVINKHLISKASAKAVVCV
jgi:hypothetical protein